VSSLQVLDVYVAGNYSYTKACIRLERLSAIYVMQISLACLIVLLSYLGSWIAPTAAPGRIALGIISILIVANNYQSVQRSLPKVAYSVFMMDFLLGALVFNVVAFISYTVTNFAMLVDAEIEAVRKAGTAQDMDRDGVLDWSELRRAVLKLSTKLFAAGAPPPTPKPDFEGARFIGSPEPGIEQGGPSGASTETLEVYATVSQKPAVNISAAPAATPTPNVLRRERTGANFDAQFNTKKKFLMLDTWGCLPTLALLKPQSVRHLKHLDRFVRAFMPPAFIIYCVCMFSTVHLWKSSVNSPLSAVESCAN
jgi:hypothetical protein